MEPFSHKVEKPWGYEILLSTPDQPFGSKIAFTKAGHRWSFQFHDQKEENICLFSGQAEIWLENEEGETQKMPMKTLAGYHIKPNKKHRFCALTDCWTFESSTPEVGNTVRLEDDYQRDTETEDVRKLPDRGWPFTKAVQDKKGSHG